MTKLSSTNISSTNSTDLSSAALSQRKLTLNRLSMLMRELTGSLLRRRSRMLVALLSILIGASLLNALISLYVDVPKQLSEQFRHYGSNLILVPNEGQTEFKQDDLALFEQVVLKIAKQSNQKDALVGVTSFAFKTIKIHELPFVLCVTDFDLLKKTSPYIDIEGQNPKDNQVLLGQNVYSKLKAEEGKNLEFSILNNLGLNETIHVRVSGKLSSGDGFDDYLFVSFKDAQKLLKSINFKDTDIELCQASLRLDEVQLKSVVDDINTKNFSFKAKLVGKVAKAEQRVLSKLKGLVYIVSLVIMVLTMVCVSTTMMAVVIERRKEIGLRKAIGATNHDITVLFMGEAVLLALIGGLLGMACGYVLSNLISSSVFNSQLEFSLSLGLLTLMLAILITCLSSVIPVRMAIKVNPSKVLKGE